MGDWWLLCAPSMPGVWRGLYMIQAGASRAGTALVTCHLQIAQEDREGRRRRGGGEDSLRDSRPARCRWRKTVASKGKRAAEMDECATPWWWWCGRGSRDARLGTGRRESRV